MLFNVVRVFVFGFIASLLVSPNSALAQITCAAVDGGQMLVVDQDGANCSVLTNATPPPPVNGAQFRSFTNFASVDVIRVVAGATSEASSVTCPGATITPFAGAGTSVALTPGSSCQVTATFNNPSGTFTVTGVIAVSAASRSSLTGIEVTGAEFVTAAPVEVPVLPPILFWVLLSVLLLVSKNSLTKSKIGY